jgi:hypothetical protein
MTRALYKLEEKYNVLKGVKSSDLIGRIRKKAKINCMQETAITLHCALINFYETIHFTERIFHIAHNISPYFSV